VGILSVTGFFEICLVKKHREEKLDRSGGATTRGDEGGECSIDTDASSECGKVDWPA